MPKILFVYSPSKICHLPVAATSVTFSAGRRKDFTATACNSAAVKVLFTVSFIFISVAPVATARRIFAFLSISMAISTVDSFAPDFMICSKASWRIVLISCSVGLETVLSTTSRTIAIATPIVEIIGAFLTIFHCTFILLPR